MKSYQLSEKEQKAYEYCIEAGIIISPHFTFLPNEWSVAIATRNDYKNLNFSPETYGPGEIWEKCAEYYVWYYDKHLTKTQSNEK